MPKKPTIHRVETLAQTRIFRVEGVELEFSNGARRQFERINNPNSGAVSVLPLIDDSLILVSEYAVGAERYELGFVKGVIDPGESPIEAANRELKEEIGFGARSIEHIRSMTMTPHYTAAKSHLLLAQDLYEDPQEGDEPEPLIQTRWPLHALSALLEHNQITDVRTLHAIYWLRDHLQK
jgi:ADP-ribose diphosphatase